MHWKMVQGCIGSGKTRENSTTIQNCTKLFISRVFFFVDHGIPFRPQKLYRGNFQSRKEGGGDLVSHRKCNGRNIFCIFEPPQPILWSGFVQARGILRVPKIGVAFGIPPSPPYSPTGGIKNGYKRFPEYTFS